ncbi:MAG: DUF488 domain-containing protein [Anaerolineales bacterium]|nr:DUF488 domain-containing protein [Anaerolineales bacterium]
MDEPIIIFTIGHSNHSLQKLAQLLKENGIAALVDVRSAPYSRHFPWFNKEHLEFELPRLGIEYIYAGKALGGRPDDPSLYKKREMPTEGADYLHEVDYPAVMKRSYFIKGVERMLETAVQKTTALMCSEEDPADCHRHHLITRYLLDEFPEVEIHHIRGDGTVFNAHQIVKKVDTPNATQGKLF